MTAEAKTAVKPTAGCAKCGSCCDPVIMEADVFLRLTRWARTEGQATANEAFAAQHWHPIEAWADAEGVECFSLRCDMFDQETRLCNARESRPPVCSGFPWYGGPPSAKRGAGMVRECSYLADLPPDQRPEGSRPLIPIEPVAHPA